MDPRCHTDWRSTWRSATGPLNRQRGWGLAGNQASCARRDLVAGSGRHRTQVRRHEHTQVTWSLPMGKRVIRCWVTAEVIATGGAGVPPGRVRWALEHLGRWSPNHDYVADALKRPNRTIAGSWIGLHNPPVSPVPSRATARIVAVPLPLRGRTNTGPLRAWSSIRSAAQKGMRRGSPTQRQGRTRSSPLPL
jgi:hypothetical protein